MPTNEMANILVFSCLCNSNCTKETVLTQSSCNKKNAFHMSLTKNSKSLRARKAQKQRISFHRMLPFRKCSSNTCLTSHTAKDAVGRSSQMAGRQKVSHLVEDSFATWMGAAVCRCCRHQSHTKLGS